MKYEYQGIKLGDSIEKIINLLNNENIKSKIIELKEIPICKLVEELSKREGVEKFKKRMSYYIFNIQKIIKIF